MSLATDQQYPIFKQDPFVVTSDVDLVAETAKQVKLFSAGYLPMFLNDLKPGHLKFVVKIIVGGSIQHMELLQVPRADPDCSATIDEAWSQMCPRIGISGEPLPEMMPDRAVVKRAGVHDEVTARTQYVIRPSKERPWLGDVLGTIEHHGISECVRSEPNPENIAFNQHCSAGIGSNFSAQVGKIRGAPDGGKLVERYVYTYRKFGSMCRGCCHAVASTTANIDEPLTSQFFRNVSLNLVPGMLVPFSEVTNGICHEESSLATRTGYHE